MSHLALRNATASSIYSEERGPTQALDQSRMDTIFCTHKDDLEPYFSAEFDAPCGVGVSLIEIFGDLRGPEARSPDHVLDGIYVVLKDRVGNAIWTSCTATAPLRDASLRFHVPKMLWAFAITVHRRASHGSSRPYLCTSLIRAFGQRPQKVLLLCRHGQAEHNIGANYQPDRGPSLTGNGEKQAQQIADRLAGLPPPGVIMISPQLRALQTAYLARQSTGSLLSLPVCIDMEAHEVGYYSVGCEIPAGAAVAEMFQADAVLKQHVLDNLPTHSCTAKESPDELATRARSLLIKLLARSEEVLMLVAHGGINLEIRGVLDPSQSIPAAAQPTGRFAQDNCEIVPLVIA